MASLRGDVLRLIVGVTLGISCAGCSDDASQGNPSTGVPPNAGGSAPIAGASGAGAAPAPNATDPTKATLTSGMLEGDVLGSSDANDDDERLQFDPQYALLRSFRKEECALWREYAGQQ